MTIKWHVSIWLSSWVCAYPGMTTAKLSGRALRCAAWNSNRQLAKHFAVRLASKTSNGFERLETRGVDSMQKKPSKGQCISSFELASAQNALNQALSCKTIECCPARCTARRVSQCVTARSCVINNYRFNLSLIFQSVNQHYRNTPARCAGNEDGVRALGTSQCEVECRMRSETHGYVRGFAADALRLRCRECRTDHYLRDEWRIDLGRAAIRASLNACHHVEM